MPSFLISLGLWTKCHAENVFQVAPRLTVGGAAALFIFEKEGRDLDPIGG